MKRKNGNCESHNSHLPNAQRRQQFHVIFLRLQQLPDDILFHGFVRHWLARLRRIDSFKWLGRHLQNWLLNIINITVIQMLRRLFAAATLWPVCVLVRTWKWIDDLQNTHRKSAQHAQITVKFKSLSMCRAKPEHRIPCQLPGTICATRNRLDAMPAFKRKATEIV